MLRPQAIPRYPQKVYGQQRISESPSGTGDQYANLELRDVVLFSAECRNLNQHFAELANLFFQRGTIANMKGNPIPLDAGFASAYCPLIWTGQMILSGPWVLTAAVKHDLAVVHELKAYTIPLEVFT